MSDLGNLPREFETWFFKEWGMTPHSFSEVHGTGDVKRCLRLWGLQQSKIEQLEREKEHLAEMNQRYIGKPQEQQDMIAKLREEKAELQGRINTTVRLLKNVGLRTTDKAILILRGESDQHLTR